MPKLFVTSDIHSFYTPFKAALNEKGFDKNNPDHYLVVCGDCFDRSDESEELLHFLMSLERKILVRGNHDLLLRDLCERGFPYRHDYHNGTTKTVYDLGNAGVGNDFEECCKITQNKLKEYNGLLVNYFETQNYIFVHSWIPTSKKEKLHPADKWISLATDEYMEDWRNANDVEWEDAMCGNPFFKWQDGLNKTGKTIVFGHWHCSLGHLIASDGELTEFGPDACWEPFVHDNIIGVDRCTAHTGEVNVVVLEDEFLEGDE